MRGWAWAVATLLLWGCADTESNADATVSISGDAFSFELPGQPYGRIGGATITVLEDSSLSTVTDADGHFALDGLTPDTEATFVLTASGFPEAQTKTFIVPGSGLERVTFQVPDDGLTNTLASVLGIDIDMTRCQIASTVTVVGKSIYDDGAHGEAGATVTIEPDDGTLDGPVYFNDSVIPQRSLGETSTDGGVVYSNVPPATYTLHADKPGVSFDDVLVKCRPGVLVNASPPYGLQAR